MTARLDRSIKQKKQKQSTGLAKRISETVKQTQLF